MAATDARPVPIKNTAFRVTFVILDNDGDPVTGATGLDSEVSKDGAAFADCTNEATEISAGVYYLDLTSTEMNADTVAVQVKTTSTDAKTTVLVFYPQEAGDIKVDLETVKTQTVTCGAGVTVLASVGTAATSTAQTGDCFARLGAPAGASVSADIAAIEAQTDDIGVAGAGLTGIPWNAAWDAEVQSEVQDAIEANHLDHLLAATYDPASKPGAADALLNELVENDGGVARYSANALEQAPSGGLDAAGVRAAVGLAAANLDTQLTAIDDAIDTEVAAIKAKTDLIPAAPAAVGDIPTAVQNADALLNRNINGGGNGTRTVEESLAFLRNKWSISGTTLTVYDVDDSTPLWTATVSTNAAADPVTGNDPT